MAIKPRLKKDWMGLKVRTLQDLDDGNVFIPAGTICEVQRNWGGLYLKPAPCPCCGVHICIHKVPETAVELYP